MEPTISFNIDVPEGKKAVLKDNKIVFEDIKPKLPKTWEEFLKSNKYYSKEAYYISTSKYYKKNTYNFPTETALLVPDFTTVKRYFALIKLHWLRDCYRQGWKPNWDDNNKKYYIGHYDNSNHCRVYQESFFPNFLSFQTEELAEEFLNNFRDLIEEAGDLI